MNFKYLVFVFLVIFQSLMLHTSADETCQLPVSVGNCKAAIQRYYYDSIKGECSAFTYGGCHGNENNFDSPENCLAKCGGENTEQKHKPKTEGPDSICQLPASVGNCKAAIERYYYDSTKGECSAFTYGGCHGNENNFDSPENCLAKCGGENTEQKHKPKTEGPDSICQLPASVGNCKAAIERYYYDSTKGECSAFTYGGCHGNENNFDSPENCMAKCGGENTQQKHTNKPEGPDSICQLPASVGYCKARFRNYYYDSTTGQCTLFTYGGCHGNENNFKTLEDCMAKCGGA